jgi:RNA polymerase sigma-70 factor (ECF subfamily)
VIRHAALAHLQRQRRTQQQIVSQWPEVPEPAGDESELDRRIEAEWTTYLANMAMSRIREQFQGRAIEVFEMSLDGRAIDEITAATGLTAASVYTLRKRVKRRLLLEIRTLIQELEP